MRIHRLKRRKALLAIATVVALAFVSFAWYLGFVPVASGPARSGMRNALDLNALPSSVRVNSSASESWTDYLFEVDFTISPEQFDQLLSGRNFIRIPCSPSNEKTTNAYRINDHKGFQIDAIWRWKHQDPSGSPNDNEAICTIYTNKTRDRVFITFIAD